MTEPVRFDGDLPSISCSTRRLPCGLDVIVHPDHEAPHVVVSIWYRVGSSDERPDRTGFAHLFEHMFKGPRAHLGAHHYDLLKRAGGSGNASTNVDRTQYWEQLPAHELELGLWLESGRMGYFADGFDEQRLVTQQSVVRAERRQQYEVVPYGPDRFAIGLALYPDGHPLRHLIIGRHDDIQAATVDDVLAFYRTWYVPANAMLAIGGDVPDHIDELVDRYFGSFPASTRPTRQTPPPFTPPRSSIQVADPFAALGRIHRAWLGPAAFAADEPELDVLATAWSAVGTGALWRRLVYESQLAQRVSTWTQNTRLGGEFHVAIDLRTGSDPGAVRAILDEECTRGIDSLSLQRALTRREASTLWGLVRVDRRVSTLQRNALYTSEPDGLAADLLRYRAITPASIDAAIARWLDPSRMIEVETLPNR